MATLPSIGFLRLKQIIGDPNADPPIPALIPVGKSTWWAGVKAGRFPKPTKALGPGITAWHIDDIRNYIAFAASDPQPTHHDEYLSSRVVDASARPGLCELNVGREVDPDKT